jgi:nucleoid-associated protein YgaU
MINVRKGWIILYAFMILGTAFAFGQSTLLDNPDYRKALDLQRMAKQAYETGDYQKSVEYSRQSEELSKTARAEAETQRLRWLAYNLRNRAAERIAFGEKNKAETRYPEVWMEATASYAAARKTFDAGEYEASAAASRKVVELLSKVQPELKASTASARPPETRILPAFYEVRLMESSRDCFWRIAGYPFVYGNPWKWRLIYDANKDKLPDPANPDLIEPGIMLVIPPLAGETRAGTWVP